MTGFLAGLTSVLALVLIHFGARRIRSSHAERRHQKRMNGDAIDVPARLRGRGPAHPRFWRAGTFELATATWRPRGPWGMPASLAGGQFSDVQQGTRKNALPPVAWDDLLITAYDRDGYVFQVAVLDEAEAGMVARCLDTATPQPDRDIRPVRLRWLRNRVPLAALALLVLTILTVGYLTVPLIGQAEVDAVVVTNRGPEYLCEVAWVDPPAHRTGHGYVDCGDRQVGDHVLVHAMGWPRRGTAEDPWSAIVTAGLFGLLGLLIAGPMIGVSALQIRRLARNTAPRYRSRPQRPPQVVESVD